MGKDARGLTMFWSISCSMPPEVGDNRWSRKIIEAAANAKNMTNQAVTPDTEANPRRAGCGESRMPGSEGGVEKHSSAVRSAPTLRAGWYAVLADPQMPVTSTLLDQAHNAMDRKLFMMKGFHHPQGNQEAFLRGLAHLYNLVPYQRRAKHAGRCGVEVEGGKVPTRDWLLNLQILTSGGFHWTAETLHH
jgi:hypothetical protein